MTAAIAVTRASLPRGHSIGEVALGTLSAPQPCLVRAYYREVEAVTPLPIPAGTAALLLALVVHGTRLEIWPVLKAIALYLRSAAAGLSDFAGRTRPAGYLRARM